MIAARSSFVTTRSGTWNPVAMNSVRGIGVPCENGAPAEDLPPTRGLAREFMDLSVTRAQYDAVSGARHLPDVLKKVLEGARRPKGDDRYVLHLTYEEATPLNQLCPSNLHTDPVAGVAPPAKS